MMKLWKKIKRQQRPQTSPVSLTNNVAPQVGKLESEKRNGGANFGIVASLLTDVGCHREVNEDAGRYVQPRDEQVLADKGLLAIVADGMGGHSAGEVASRIATEVINRVYYEDEDTGDSGKALRRAFHEANRQIFEAAQKQINLQGMGTTCTTLVLCQGKAMCAYVGDTRLYLVRDSEIYILTEDHSAVMQMVKHGLLSQDEARHHIDKNVILRALGSHQEVQVTVWNEPLPVKEDDRFLLCSDGLYDLVEDQEIKQIVLNEQPHPACENLIALAKARGGYDNITVGLLKVTAAASMQTEAPRQTREVQLAEMEGAK